MLRKSQKTGPAAHYDDNEKTALTNSALENRLNSIMQATSGQNYIGQSQAKP